MKSLVILISTLLAMVSFVGAELGGKPILKKSPKEAFAEQLGKVISLTGTAGNDPKIGAYLQSNEIGCIYIEGLENWPKELYDKKVTVTGTLIEKHDLPVYIPKNRQDIRSGIAVRKGTDLHEAAHRFLLKDVKWTVVEEAAKGK